MCTYIHTYTQHTHAHTYIHTYIPWIQKVAKIMVGCEIRHKYKIQYIKSMQNIQNICSTDNAESLNFSLFVHPLSHICK